VEAACAADRRRHQDPRGPGRKASRQEREARERLV